MEVIGGNINDWRDREPDSESRKKVETNFTGYLKRVIGRIPFAVDVTALYLLFRDPEYPVMKKGICVFALIYFITPVDLIPDAIPVAGMLDDAGVIAAAVKLYSDDINPYKADANAWLKENGFIK